MINMNTIFTGNSYSSTKQSKLAQSSDSFATQYAKEAFLQHQEMDTYTSSCDDYTCVTTTSDTYENLAYKNIIDQSRVSPYASMAGTSGTISYNGVTYQYDSANQYISLGDMTEKDNILTIPLSTGDTLRINRNNIDDVAKSITMFTPKDQKIIMDAIYTDAKCRNKKAEVEQLENEVVGSLVDHSSQSDSDEDDTEK